MKTFIKELETRRRARLGALLHRHKAGIGYVALLAGVLIALGAAGKAIRATDHRADRLAGIICTNTVRADRQQLTNLVTKSGHELIASFHLTIPQARKLIHKQLVQSARERRELQPSEPRSACSPKLTVLKVPPQTRPTR